MKRIVFFLLTCLIISCRQDSLVIDARIDWTPVYTQLQKIQFTQIHFDTLLIRGKDDLLLPSRRVLKILIGDRLPGGYNIRDTLLPGYETVEGGERLHFSYRWRIDRARIFDSILVRYLLSDSSLFDVDMVAPLFKYPYPSTEFFLRENFDDLTPQDFDFQNDSIMFIHPYGPVGLYRYNIRTQEFTLLFDYSSGDYIAYVSPYVFCDVDHDRIERYNISTDSVDLSINLSPSFTNAILGLEVYNDTVYVLFGNGGLGKFTRDLRYVGTIPYTHTTTLWLTVHDGIVYSSDYIANLFTRFNLSSRSFLPGVVWPTRATDAIKTYNGKLFFTDYERRFFGWIPITDLHEPPDVTVK